MRRSLSALSLVLALGLYSSGCGGNAAGGDGGSGGGGGSGGSGGNGGTGGVAECLPVSAPANLTAEAAVTDYLTGRWVLCDGAMVQSGAGIEIEAGGAWHLLKVGDNGQLVADWTRAGSEIELYNNDPGWQISFYSADGGEYMSAGAFYPGSPDRLSLTFFGWDTETLGWYVREN